MFQRIFRSQLVSRLLQRSGLAYTHLAVPTPKEFKHGPKENWAKKPRGVIQRNFALQWISDHLNSLDKVHNHTPTGVLYFADDDNVYDLAVFDEVSLHFDNSFVSSMS
jgi:Glycosyltransferase family 43